MGAEVVGIDPSENSIKQAEEHLTKNDKVKHLGAYRVGTVETMEPEEFDLVICSQVLEHVNDFPLVVKGMVEKTKVKKIY